MKNFILSILLLSTIYNLGKFGIAASNLNVAEEGLHRLAVSTARLALRSCGWGYEHIVGLSKFHESDVLKVSKLNVGYEAYSALLADGTCIDAEDGPDGISVIRLITILHGAGSVFVQMPLSNDYFFLIRKIYQNAEIEKNISKNV